MADLKAYIEESTDNQSGVMIGRKYVGYGHPVYIVAEIGINHNGSLETALSLIDNAVEAGCDAVKFQKRSPDICVPTQQKYQRRNTPWGVMSYIDYRHRVEFSFNQYCEIDRYCRNKNITWFASCWDTESIDFMEAFDLPAYKVASACLTDEKILLRLQEKRKPIVLSTGMSSMSQVRRAVALLEKQLLVILHTTSSYQFNPSEINLRVIDTLQREFNRPIGYSGHEVGFASTLAATALGAVFIERHITLDRSMWGSDHSISLDPIQLKRMVRDVRIIEKAMGDGVKKIYESEQLASQKLRNCKAV